MVTWGLTGGTTELQSTTTVGMPKSTGLRGVTPAGSPRELPSAPPEMSGGS